MSNESSHTRHTSRPKACAASSFGAHAARQQDNLYILRRGMMFTSPSIAVEQVNGTFAMLMLAVYDAQLHVQVATKADQYQAIAVKPLVRRLISAVETPMICLAIDPLHPQFRRFRALTDGVQRLPRTPFRRLDNAIEAALLGKLTYREAARLFEQIVKIAANFLPRLDRFGDARVAAAVQLLDQQPNCDLEYLAERVGLSAHRLSHLFSEVIGLPLRHFQVWQKLNAAGRLANSVDSLTELARCAGFHDAQHMYRTFVHSFGTGPSYFLRNDDVRRFWPQRSTTCTRPSLTSPMMAAAL